MSTEELSRQIADGVVADTDVPVYARDLDGRFLVANPALHAVLGQPDGQLIGRDAAEMFPGQVVKDLRANDSDVARRGQPRLFAESVPHPDGTDHSYLSTRFPLKDDEGIVVAVAGVTTDVTDLFDARTASAQSEQRWRELVERVPVAVVVYDTATLRLRYVNPRAARLLGCEHHSEIVGRTLADILTTAAAAEFQRLLAPVESGEELSNTPFSLVGVDGTVRALAVNAVRVSYDDRDAVQLTLQDVTDEQAVQAALRESAAFHDAVLAATPDVIYLLDLRTGQPLWSSRNLLHAFGYSDEDVQDWDGDVVAGLVHPDDAEQMRRDNRAAAELADGKASRLRYRFKDKAGEYRWLSRRVTPFERDDTGEVIQLLAVARDVTDVVDAEQRVAEAALHDPLTGLPNRRLLSDRLTSALSRTARSGADIAVLCVDLDGFKHVNDISGHGAGDRVLSEAARRLSAQLRPQDTVARVGGDEFVVILEHAAPRSENHDEGGNSPKAAHRRHAMAVARRIRAAIAEPIVIGGETHTLTASVGLAFAEVGDDPEDALRNANSAMFRAKTVGKDRIELFDAKLRVEAVERGRVERLLRNALGEHDNSLSDQAAPTACSEAPAFWVAYQPIAALGTGQIVGFEALARLNDCDGNPVAPDVFIPIAEETGLIGPLGTFVLQQACRDLADWQVRHPHWGQLGMSVNLSARQAGLGSLVGQVTAALAAAKLAPQQLTLELTETALLEAGQSTMTELHTLRGRGIHIDIDDFGTGYASLKYLAQLPVTGVKVDRSFTAGLPDNPTSTAIVQAITGLARSLNLSCVVEGIETVAQQQALPTDVYGQGYLIGRPAPTEQTQRLLGARAQTVLESTECH